MARSKDIATVAPRTKRAKEAKHAREVRLAKKAKRTERTERRRDQTATEILQAGRDVVLRAGIRDFSLAAVAGELGLTTPALYYYFDSKEALLVGLVLRELLDAAAEVEAAVQAAETGAEAVEQLIRTVFERYATRLDLFSLAYHTSAARELQGLIGPEDLARLRPINDMLYGGVEARLRADQRSSRFPKRRNPRLFAFNAHMAVVGVLTMKAVTAQADDPLIHSDEALVDDLCQTFCGVAQGGGKA